MPEAIHNSPEQDPRGEDAAQLASLFYYAADRAHKVDEFELGEALESIGTYCIFRAEQDPEMGRALIEAFESFQDPDPQLALPESADDMRELAGLLRETLGLPTTDTPLGKPSDSHA